MAKQVWNNPIDKSVDWGGDEATGGLPVSGEMVQRFIKETFSQKAGVFYYDNTNNRYLVFADEGAQEEFLLDPTKTELIIGTFDAPFNYSAEISLTSPAFNAVFLGSTGNYIDFTFDIKNKQGSSTGENVTVTYTFIRNAIRQTFTETRKFGDSVHFNVDKYIGEGTNTIMVGIVGQTSLAATTVAITYQVVNLTLEDELDISKAYDLTKGAQTLQVPFTVSGYGTKIVEWYLDGEMLPFVKADDEVTDVIATRTKYISLANLQQGAHSLQIRAYTVINGEKFYTDTLYRDVMVYTGTSSDIIIAVAMSMPSSYGVVGPEDSAVITDIVQYVPYTLRFATYIPSNASNTPVIVSLDGEVKGSIGSSNNIENAFVITVGKEGSATLNISSQNVSRDIPVIVKKTTMNIYEITSGLTLDFNADGKSNNSIDKDSWSYGNYTGTFTGFNWNNYSGWVNGRLEMNAGSSFSINHAPLSGSPTNTGKTIELEWATKNVTNDDAIICDLRNADGVGVLIKATKVVLTSADGVTIETEYKSGENVRIAFVINKATGVPNKHLSFIYANGVLSRGETWAETDNYTSNTEITFTATAEAEISLKAIRIYDTALSSDDILNNYTLYRDTIAEMLDVYDRNDVYETGSTDFSPERMMSRLPVMIVTGDIPTLEATSDKDTQIVVDIEYYNNQEPSKSFTMRKAAMRPQGTSSMGYPKKNFRIYTQKVAETQLFDANGMLVEDKLYSFKDGSQPVNCWCLKADYAESSGTHNTGIARLWNNALFNAQIDGEYKLRTNAQKIAKAGNYPYDVRTTIDGFPILLFYRPTANDDLIFIGKYNFNNDKSTESVFGFTDIPNFDNTKMQCWEILNNGNALALFTTTEGFDEGWKEAFESRYPDTKTPYTGDLKAFCEWMTNVSNGDFSTQKWEHLDVYKMAAYWVYLMRHAAADQFVKNAMLTSEDGQHFYFILYDNDTINGLINTGDIRINPTDDRQTVDASGSYVFAGHDSRLWNMLEADEEFQEIVSVVDNALYSAGISYVNTIRMFDEEQAGKWIERVYNRDAQYKYVGPYTESGTNNLFMLQGKRDLHRRWWLAKRFFIYDAKYVSGTYKSEAVEIKCLNGTSAGQQFSIVSGYPFDYGYGINNLPREKNVYLEEGASHTFTTEEVVNVGDPIRIYGAPNIAELDLSLMMERLAVLNVTKASSETLGAQMRKLVIGKNGGSNVELAEISGLRGLVMLEHLDIQGLKNVTSVDLSNQSQMKVLKAFGSGISSAIFTDGAPLERLELPTTLRAIKLNQHANITFDNIFFEGGMSNISSISITGCPNLSNDFGWVRDWYNGKTASDEYSSLVMDNVNWKNVGVDELVALTNMSAISLKGTVKINDITLEQANRLLEVFGETAFHKDSEFYINAPDAIFIVGGEDNVLEGESAKYTCVTFGEEATVTYQIYSGGNSYISIDENTGVLTTLEGAAGSSSGKDIVIRAVARTVNGNNFTNRTVHIVQRTYPDANHLLVFANSYIENELTTHTLKIYDNSDEGYNGDYEVVWSLPDAFDGFAEIESYTRETCIVKKLQEPDTFIRGSITATIRRRYNGSAVSTQTMTTYVMSESIAEADSGVVSALYAKGFCANSSYVTKEEAAVIKPSDIQTGTSSSQTSVFYGKTIYTFMGFRHFIGITYIPIYLLARHSRLTHICLPETATDIKKNGVELNGLLYAYIPSALSDFNLGYGVDQGGWHTNTYWEVNHNNETFVSENGVLYKRSGQLVRCSKKYLRHYVLPEWVSSIATSAFSENTLESITIHKDVSMSGGVFSGSKFKDLYLDSHATSDINASAPTGFSASLHIGTHVDERITSTLGFYAMNTFGSRIDVAEGGLLKIVGGALYTLKDDLIQALNGTSEFILPEGITIRQYAFRYSSAKKVVFPEGLTEIPQGCFDSYVAPVEVHFPSTITKIGANAFRLPTSLKIIKSKAVIPPTLESGAFYFNNTNVAVEVEVPVGTVDAYKAAWNRSGFTYKEAYEPTECVSLSIVANDTNGRATTTAIQYTAITNGIDKFTGERYEGIEITGTGVSSEFPQNTSETETVEREVSFTYMGVTATTTITQGVWINQFYTLDLNNGQWELSATPANPDSTIYDGVYRSVKSKGVNNGYDTMYIDIVGYESFKLYIRSYGESGYDYVIVSKLDQTITGTTAYSNSAVMGHTYNKATATTSISGYTLVEFTGIDSGEHRITVIYRKDSSGNNNDDRGYVLIPFEQ